MDELTCLLSTVTGLPSGSHYAGSNPHISVFQGYTKTFTMTMSTLRPDCGYYTISSDTSWVTATNNAALATETVTITPTYSFGDSNNIIPDTYYATLTLAFTDHGLAQTTTHTFEIEVMSQPCLNT